MFEIEVAADVVATQSPQHIMEHFKLPGGQFGERVEGVAACEVFLFGLCVLKELSYLCGRLFFGGCLGNIMRQAVLIF